MDSRVAVIGDSESIKGFAAVGFDIYECQDEHTAATTLKKLIDGSEYAIVFVTEQFFVGLEKERSKIAQSLTPAVVPLPSVTTSDGVGMARLSSFVEKAVGSDIIFND